MEELLSCFRFSQVLFTIMELHGCHGKDHWKKKSNEGKRLQFINRSRPFNHAEMVGFHLIEKGGKVNRIIVKRKSGLTRNIETDKGPLQFDKTREKKM